MTFSPTILKLNNSFNAQTIAKNITANRSGISAMMKNSGYNTYGTNLLFTPPRRMGGTPQYMSSGAISRMANGQNMRLVSGFPDLGSTTAINRQVNIGTSSAYNAGVAVGTGFNVAFQVAGLLKDLGVFSNNKVPITPNTNSGKLDAGLAGLGGNPTAATVPLSSDISGAINGMSSAQSSGELRSAIASANGQLSSLNNQSGELKNMADFAEKNIDTYATCKKEAETKVGDLNSQVNQGEKSVATAKDSLKAAYGVLSDKQSKYVDAHSNKIIAEQRKADAESHVPAAEQAVSTAQGRIDAVNSQLNGLGNSPEEQVRKTQLKIELKEAEAEKKAAEERLTAAKKAVTDAGQALKEAETIEDNSKTALEEAKEKVPEENDKVKAEESKLQTIVKSQDTAKQELETAKSEMEIAENTYKELSEAGPKFKAHTDNILKLQTEIEKYSKELTKMEEKEAKNLAKVDQSIEKNEAEINRLNGKYDFSDEKTSKGEQRALGKKSGLVDANGQLTQQQVGLKGLQSDTDFIKNMLSGQPTKIGKNGERYYTGRTPSGATVYYKENIPITKEMFDAGT